ncbi:hypothetical protein NA56DRAFT_696154 [Hyaloscypha hepaticicola]|uniref:Uncharacterized protein n=1 Tax=Hyaloscypha hepaticicola TaxID=2082293 RepID=A0A2J6QQ40_9HELO|nr:hypothetical protein NA56DRAFT_696154 [Hyaloscypha hepaticicola]
MFSKLLLALAAFTCTTLSAPSQQQTSTVPNVYWTVKNLTRDCTPPTIPSPSCSYQFIISATNAQPDFNCNLTDWGSPVSPQNNALTDPRYSSFGAYPCNGDNAHSGGWQISWGYNSNQDSAVMTVVNQNLNEDAWFGWNHVNNRTWFETVGPNSVYNLGSFS